MLEALAAAAIYATFGTRLQHSLSNVWFRNCCYRSALIATNRRQDCSGQIMLLCICRNMMKMYISKKKLLEKQTIKVPGLRIIATDYSESNRDAKKNATAAGMLT